VQGEIGANSGESQLDPEALGVGGAKFPVPGQGGSAAYRQDHEDQARRLQPEDIGGPAYGNHKGLAPGENRVQKAVFLYNALQGVFDIGNFGHLGLL